LQRGRGRTTLSTGEGRTDARRDINREAANRRAVPVHHRQHDGCGVAPAEGARQLRERLGLGAAKGVGRDIGVSERDDRGATNGECREQVEPARSGVVSVIEHHQHRKGRHAGHRVAHEPDRGAHEFGRVKLAGPRRAEDAPVLVNKVGDSGPLGGRTFTGGRAQLVGAPTVLAEP